MIPERLAQIEEIYYDALEVDLEERAAYLKGVCKDDDELIREVGSLLSFTGAPSNLIDTPPIDIAAEMFFDKTGSEVVGTTVDHYNIISKIGTGGMGDVYLAEDNKLERRVAIKFIKIEFAENADQLSRFIREAKTASSLNHPNIITVHDIGSTEGIHYIATEFIEGLTLRDAMQSASLTFVEKLDVAIQAATALKAAHLAGIFHRDIKPDNIMLRDDGIVKVLDFGLAKLSKLPVLASREAPVSPADSIARDPQLTSPGLVMGTAAYMSPEQARIGPVDSRSDIWSLGVVMFEMFAGEKPFKGSTSAEMIASILNNSPALLEEPIPAGLRQLIYRSIEKDPNDRYQTADEILKKLKELKKKLAKDQLLEADVFLTIGTERRSSRTDEERDRNTGGLSSAEFVVESVRNHKALSAAALVVFILGLSVIGYTYLAAQPQPYTSIAVLPFMNENGEDNLEHLSDGISEALINELSQLPGIKVIASGSSFKYKGRSVDLQQVAHELGVQTILVGRLSQQDDKFYVSSELIDVADNSQIWGEKFDRKTSEFTQVQDHILGKIVKSLGLRPSSVKLRQMAAGTKADPQAYEYLLRGRFYQSKGTEDGAKKAVEYFDRALEIDTDYALAYAALARTYQYMGANGFQDPTDMLAKAQTAAIRAHELDDSLPEVHLALAGIRRIEWDWAEAEREYKKAAELNINLAANHFGYSFFLSTQGRHEEALKEMTLGRDLDPLKNNVNSDLAYTLYFARRYEQALEQYNIGLELDPGYGGGYYGRGLIHTATGQYEKGIADFNEMIRLSGDNPGVYCYLGYALAKVGRLGEARTILKRLETGKQYVSPVELAVLYVGVGEKDKALASLERAYDERDSQIQFLVVEPHFDSLRNEPRFAALVEKVGLPL